MKNKKALIILLSVLTFWSCDKEVLDKLPLNVFTELDVWTDASLAEGFLLDIYNDVVKDLYSNQYTDEWTDNCVPNDGGGGSAWVLAQNFDATTDFGWNQFGKIRKANILIERLSDPESPIDESTKTRLVAEAKVLRAMTYFWMARRFGGIIIIDKPLSSNDDFQLPRATEAETYNFIISDIESAIPNLSATAPKDRISSGMANALLARVALQKGDYDKVIAAANAVETLGYTLDETYSNLFNSYSGTISSPEVIFYYNRGEDANRFIDTRIFRSLPNVTNGIKLREDAVPQFSEDDSFEAWPERWPSQELVDSYLIEESGQAVMKDYTNFVGQPSKLMWQNRDARFEQSIVRDSAQYSKSIFTFRRGGNMHWTSNPLSTWGMSESGYMFRKWMYEDHFVFWNYPVDWAEPLFRLGEVYLNKAEAYGRKGNLTNAIEYLNKTRVAHGGLPELSSGTSATDFWKYYKIERRVELLLENDRYWSLIRWARAENAGGIPELNGYKLHGLDMEFDGIVNVIEAPGVPTMVFEYPKRIFFPIPDNEIRENEKLAGAQNPGW